MADSAKESKDNKRKRGAAAKKEKDREKDRPPPAPPFQDIKLPEKYRLLPVPKHEGGAATNRYLRSDLVVRADRFCKRFKQVWEADGFRARAAGAGFGSRRSCLDARRGVTLGTAPRPRRHRRRESTRTIC